MLRLLLTISFISVHFLAASQVSDFISVRKKNGRTIQSFYRGSPIIAETLQGSYLDGWVEDIKHDSVFVKVYDVRYYRASYGGTIIDTVRSFIIPIHYKDIKGIKVFENKRTLPNKFSNLLIIGGAGYFVLNLFNGAYLNESVKDQKNLKSLGISLGAVGAGFLIKRLFKPNNFSEKKHRIAYVRMKTS